MKFYIRTFGCQQNYSDTERIISILESAEMSEAENIAEADIIIFNTCSIKQKAEDKAIGFFRDADKLRKNKVRQIGITGCMIRTTSHQNSFKKDPLLNRLKYLDFVFRIEDTPILPEILGGGDIKSSCVGENIENLFSIEPKIQNSFSAFVPIMSGCNKFCSYCIVPQTRGREQSRSFAKIQKDCQNLIKKGITEITLLGQNVNAYYLNDAERLSRQNQTDFAYLLDNLAQTKGLRRIRFTSPYPSEMGKDTIDIMAKHKNICNHLHLPVQSGSNRILEKMNRNYKIEDFRDLVDYAREKIPNIVITTDIIVGFPSETEEDILATLKLCEKNKFDVIYISQFSPRQGTSAEKMENNISSAEKKKRFHLIQNSLEKSAYERNLAWVGQKSEVLVEKIEKGVSTGKNEQGKFIHFLNQGEKVGDYVIVEISQAEQWFLRGRRVFEK